MLSDRSNNKKFKGGMRELNSGRNGLVYAKLLLEMPDYSNDATRATEKQLTPFQWDDNEEQYGSNLIERGPYELDNRAVFKGFWS